MAAKPRQNKGSKPFKKVLTRRQIRRRLALSLPSQTPPPTRQWRPRSLARRASKQERRVVILAFMFPFLGCAGLGLASNKNSPRLSVIKIAHTRVIPHSIQKVCHLWSDPEPTHVAAARSAAHRAAHSTARTTRHGLPGKGSACAASPCRPDSHHVTLPCAATPCSSSS